MDTKKRATPYDATIAEWEAMNPARFRDYCSRNTNPLPGLLAERAGYLLGFEDGVEAVKADPDYHGLSSPTEGVRG